jgi:hypothetical protein
MRQAEVLGPIQAHPVPRENRSVDLDKGYWRGYSVPVRQGAYAREDDQLFKIPSNEPGPGGERRNPRVFVMGNTPPWTTPPFWSRPFENSYVVCVPTYEQDYLAGTYNNVNMEMMIIQGISYHCISGLGQYEVFEIALYDGLTEKMRWEDTLMDPTTGDPSKRYVFAGDTKPLPAFLIVDRNHQLHIKVKARGFIDNNGVSVHGPGEPLVPNANFRINLHGWIAPMRDNLDGGPRPTDLGNMDHVRMDADLAWEGARVPT